MMHIQNCSLNTIYNKNYLYFTNKAILCPYNTQVYDTNIAILERLKATRVQLHASVSIDTIPAEAESYLTVRNVNETLPTGMPPHKLVLAEGTLIILLRKLDNEAGDTNATRYIM